MKQYRKLAYPYIIWATIILLIPMTLIMIYAFTSQGNDVKTLHFTFDHFAAFFSSPTYIKVLLKSLQLAFITTIICLLGGYPVAYFISRTSKRSQSLLILIVTLPMWINMLIRTYAWQSLLNDQGLINSFLGLFNLGPVSMMYTTTAIIIGMVYNFLPFMILSIYTTLSKMDRALIEAAYDLGASPIQTFRRVILPLSMPGVVSGIILVFLPATSTFIIPQILGGAQNVMIGNLIESQFINVGDWNFGSAISLILAVIILVSMFVMRRVENKYGEKND